ncbi:MAG: hypothetical protein ACTHLJ_16450 [Angustibacter sp.]
MHSGDSRSAGRRALAWRIARHVIGGLLTGAAVGYLAALILPRRYPAPAGSYRAPVPPSVDAEVG